jgi:hypothetical protein
MLQCCQLLLWRRQADYRQSMCVAAAAAAAFEAVPWVLLLLLLQHCLHCKR